DNPTTSNERPRIRTGSLRERQRKTVTVADLNEPYREERDQSQEIRDEPRSGQEKELEPPQAGGICTGRRRVRSGRIRRMSHRMLQLVGLGALGAAISASRGMQRWRVDGGL